MIAHHDPFRTTGSTIIPSFPCVDLQWTSPTNLGQLHGCVPHNWYANNHPSNQRTRQPAMWKLPWERNTHDIKRNGFEGFLFGFPAKLKMEVIISYVGSEGAPPNQPKMMRTNTGGYKKQSSTTPLRLESLAGMRSPFVAHAMPMESAWRSTLC